MRRGEDETSRARNVAPRSTTRDGMAIGAFLERNPRLGRVEKARDDAIGWRLWVSVGVFCFLLLGPVMPLIPRFRGAGPAFLAIEAVAVTAIAWCSIEYGHRRAVWFQCLSKGIVVTYEKTHEIGRWITQPAMFFAYAFLFVHALVTYLGLDPTLGGGDLVADVLTAILSMLAVLFVVLMTKNLVDTEGANALLTVPMFVYLFQDDAVLAERGFSTVDFADLAQYVIVDRASNRKFSWNEIHELQAPVGHFTPVSNRRATLLDGFRIARFLRKYNDVMS